MTKLLSIWLNSCNRSWVPVAAVTSACCCVQDLNKAFRYFSLAADQGWVDGQLQLGIMYFSECSHCHRHCIPPGLKQPCFGPHIWNSLLQDTAQPCHLLKPNWKPFSSHSISAPTNINTQFLLQSLCVCVCVCVCVFLYNTLSKLFW